MQITFNVKDEHVDSVKEAYNSYVMQATANDKVKAKKALATYEQALKTVLSQINEQLEDKLLEEAE